MWSIRWSVNFLARSVKGYLLTTRSYFNVPKVKREAFVKQLADRVQAVIAASPGAG